MQLEKLRSAARVIARFSDEMTMLVDAAMGSDWAENEEILALIALSDPVPPTTRQIAEVSGLHRRAVTRLVTRLVDDDLVTVLRDALDGRQVRVSLTAEGRQRVMTLERNLEAFFVEAHDDAAQVLALLGCRTRAVLRNDVRPLGMLQWVVTVGVQLVDAIEGPAARGRIAGRQRAALLMVAAEPVLRLSELSPALGVTPSGATYVVDQLCDRGLLIRRRAEAPDDKRAVLLEATGPGRDAAAGVYRAMERHKAALCELFAAIEGRAELVDASSR